MTQKSEAIKQTIQELMSKMHIYGEVAIDETDKENIFVSVKTDQAGFLIGQAGAHLDAFQYLARALVNKRTGEPVKFLVDVNGYRKGRIDLLKQMAHDIAKQALTQRVAVTLHPMPSYERRIIHMALCEHLDINTESIGEGEDRRVVVRPIK